MKWSTPHKYEIGSPLVYFNILENVGNMCFVDISIYRLSISTYKICVFENMCC